MDGTLENNLWVRSWRNRSHCVCRLLIQIHILNGFCNINRDLFFELDECGCRGHEKKLLKRRFRLDIRKFSNRVVDNWNSLPEQCLKVATLIRFKKPTASLEPEFSCNCTLVWVWQRDYRYDILEAWSLCFIYSSVMSFGVRCYLSINNKNWSSV